MFTANCAVCHGPDGKGKTDVGAPNLTTRIWTHGGDEASIYNDVWGGLQGQMPSWEGRLSPIDRKILALYVARPREAQAMSVLPLRRVRTRTVVGLSLLAALLLLAGANAHLVYVAVTSQPDCVDHVRAGRCRQARRIVPRGQVGLFAGSALMTSSIPAVVPPLPPASSLQAPLSAVHGGRAGWRPGGATW